MRNLTGGRAPYDFDRNGPPLDDEDEAILDRIWDRIGRTQATNSLSTFVEDLASDLWEKANTLVPVIEGSVTPQQPVDPTLTALIRMQPVRSFDRFQLPEPIQGPVASPQCIVVGQNPGVNPRALLPAFGCSREQYVAFYQDRFKSTHRHPESGRAVDYYRPRSAPRPIVIPHYRKVEELLTPAFGRQPIGNTVTYLDAIPWKSVGHRFDHWIQNDPAVISMAKERVAHIVTELRPHIVVTLGRFAARVFDTRPLRMPHVEYHTIAHGNRQWRGNVLPFYHVNARPIHASKNYWEAAQQLIVDVAANRNSEVPVAESSS